MLTGITLENFKAFKEPQFIPIKPITLVFGPNSAGKSSIMHALAFLKHVDATKGHCDPDSVEFGWEKIKLGSWQNLVHGHDASAVMKITLHWEHKALTWAFRKGPDGPYVESFEIAVNGKPVARGTNRRTKGIYWSIELHSSHPFWNTFREEIWGYISGAIKLEDEHYDEYEDENMPDDIGNLGMFDVQGERLQVKNFAVESLMNKNVRQPMKPFFDSHFDNWLGESWRELPSKSGDEIESLKKLFPGKSLGENLEDLLSEKKKFQILPIHPIPFKTPEKVEF